MEALSGIELPTAPQTAVQLIQLCGDPNTDLNEVVSAIQLDGALSAKLLRVANSAYYCQQYEITTLRRAAVVLGLDHVKVMALSFQLADQSSRWRDVPIDLQMHWQGNLLRACLARQLAINAQVFPAKCPEEAFLVGMLQDFVVPVMGQIIGSRYGDAIPASGLFTTAELTAWEDANSETNHAHLAGRMFDYWRFPPLLTFAVTNHHVTPQEVPAEDKAMALWQIAYWVGAIQFNEDRQSAPIASELRQLAEKAFKINIETLGIAFYRAIEDYELMREFFSEILPNGQSGPSILEKARELILDLDEDGILESYDEVDG
ncbi:MAG: HDOD domain-containing protein [Planctomycetota bacterium]|jgi:HD-like signal output (HDOD) protein